MEYQVGQIVFAQISHGYSRGYIYKNGVVEKVTKTQVTVKFDNETLRFMKDRGVLFGGGYHTYAYLISHELYAQEKPLADARVAAEKLKRERFGILTDMDLALRRDRLDDYTVLLQKLIELGEAK